MTLEVAYYWGSIPGLSYSIDMRPFQFPDWSQSQAFLLILLICFKDLDIRELCGEISLKSRF